LYSCVKNCAIEMHRSGKRRQQHTAAVSGANVELRLFEATPDGNEFAGAVESAMQRLPLEQREVLVMKIWGELTFQQIAETLKISSNTAASRYRYAIGALRSTVKKEAIS
jgi:RNA polymerase sigma-70 factor (ECF subfamily)